MRLLTAAAQRELDRLAAAEADLPTRVLMESAGAAVAREAASSRPRQILVFCGPGNNGGDGSVAARLLHGSCDVYTWYTRPPETLKGDALLAAKAWLATGGEAGGSAPRPGPGTVLIDAVFGSGLGRPPEGREAEAIRAMNAARERGAKLVSVDVPSGVDSDNGHVYPVHVARADVTVTLHAPKRGLYLHPGAECAGRIEVAPIGIPRSLEQKLSGPACDLIDEEWARAQFPPRPRNAHKNDFGHVLVVAGSAGKSGAAALVCEAALRCGAGLVTLAARPEVAAALHGLPEAMFVALPGEGPLAPEDLPALLAALKGKTALAIGPGIPRGPETGPLDRRASRGGGGGGPRRRRAERAGGASRAHRRMGCEGAHAPALHAASRRVRAAHRGGHRAGSGGSPGGRRPRGAALRRLLRAQGRAQRGGRSRRFHRDLRRRQPGHGDRGNGRRPHRHRRRALRPPRRRGRHRGTRPSRRLPARDGRRSGSGEDRRDAADRDRHRAHRAAAAVPALAAMNREFLMTRPAATRALGRKLGAALRPGDFVALTGDLGAGKTLLVKAAAQGASAEPASSPTFALVNLYRGPVPLQHIDLYRLSGPAELFALGFDDLLAEPAATLCEWADRAGEALPADRLELALAHAGPNARTIRLRATGPRGERLLRALEPWRSPAPPAYCEKSEVTSSRRSASTATSASSGNGRQACLPPGGGSPGSSLATAT